MSTRRQARERALQALYAFELGGGDAEDVIETVINEQLEGDAEGISFATKIFLRTLDNTADADEIISLLTQNWELSRIALVDRLVLRIAISEFMTFADIPPKVSINEAIELAKKYSTLKSGQFVNGILDSALAKLVEEGRINKRGRGLVETATQGQGQSAPPKKD